MCRDMRVLTLLTSSSFLLPVSFTSAFSLGDVGTCSLANGVFNTNQCTSKFFDIRKAAKACAATSAMLVALAIPLEPATAIDSSIVEGQIPALNPAQRRYAKILASGSPEEVASANEALLDHAVGTINTMYYDNSGGNNFDTKRMYSRWSALRAYAKNGEEGLEKWKKAELRRIERDRTDWLEVTDDPPMVSLEDRLPKEIHSMPKDVFSSRENAVEGLNWIVGTLNDPYSKYLSKEQLFQELKETSSGFCGSGALVESPQRAPDNLKLVTDVDDKLSKTKSSTYASRVSNSKGRKSTAPLLSIADVANLPVVTAVAAESLAERDGIVVGDRIVSVGRETFLGLDGNEVSRRIDARRYEDKDYFSNSKDNRRQILAIAKPIVASDAVLGQQERLLGYRISRINLAPSNGNSFDSGSSSNALVQGGDGIVNYRLLQPADSLFRRALLVDASGSEEFVSSSNIGYIRFTRFSRASTAGFVKAAKELEEAGAESYILDLRNNYGGIVQEAMLTASTLLRDPHDVLCYTLNSRGGFTPHDVEEYLVDKRFPGYLLSSEPSNVSLDQAKRENPAFFEEGPSSWSPPSAYASLHEQGVKRSLHRPAIFYTADGNDEEAQDLVNMISRNRHLSDPGEQHRIRTQKKIVVLINEGTASSAEVFAAALHDNFRAVALVGTQSYGKGLIQHTFPMPDGGGLRISIAEYLTPGLKHVSKIGGARYDPRSGAFIGGGITPDIICPSLGIPTDAGADLCVGVAIDALDIATSIDAGYQ